MAHPHQSHSDPRHVKLALVERPPSLWRCLPSLPVSVEALEGKLHAVSAETFRGGVELLLFKITRTLLVDGLLHVDRTEMSLSRAVLRHGALMQRRAASTSASVQLPSSNTIFVDGTYRAASKDRLSIH